MALKAQVLADSIAELIHDIALEPEMTLPEMKTLEKQGQEDNLAKWKLFVDESSN